MLLSVVRDSSVDQSSRSADSQLELMGGAFCQMACLSVKFGSLKKPAGHRLSMFLDWDQSEMNVQSSFFCLGFALGQVLQLELLVYVNQISSLKSADVLIVHEGQPRRSALRT
jgi:hypothetical protein